MQFPWTEQRALVSQSLTDDDRILILGAGGWFGQTLKNLLPQNASVLAHVRRTSDQPLHDFKDEVQAFNPTAVANFAFLTPHFLRTMDDASYLATNRAIFDRFLFALSLPQVRLGIHASSGAVAAPMDSISSGYSLYREVKALEESLILETDSAERCMVVRAYSVSGPYVRVPEKYAFSDMVGQALSGGVRVQSQRPTWRRFCSVADLLSVAVAMGASHGGGLIESGGESLEMRELAAAVVETVSPSASVVCADWTTDEPSIYASDNTSWVTSCQSVGFTPTPLSRQIREVRDYLAAAKA